LYSETYYSFTPSGALISFHSLFALLTCFYTSSPTPAFTSIIKAHSAVFKFTFFCFMLFRLPSFLPPSFSSRLIRIFSPLQPFASILSVYSVFSAHLSFV
jgi:hypothetical protein